MNGSGLLPGPESLTGDTVAKTCMRAKARKTPKFLVRAHNRCLRCGRSRAFYRKFQLCRLCFRSLALSGEIPGVTKSSW